MADEVSGNTLNYSDINSGKLLNKAGLLELSGQIKGYIQANTPSTVLTSQVDTGKVDQTTNDPIFLDDYLDDLEMAISNTTTYTLPTASTSTLGGVKIDDTSIKINNKGVIRYGLSDRIKDGNPGIKLNASMEASGWSSLAIGGWTKAKGYASFSGGTDSVSNSKASFAFGVDCRTGDETTVMPGNPAFYQGSIALGVSTRAFSRASLAFGEGNIQDQNKVFLEMVGNGSSIQRSNASALDWSGNQYLAGNLFVNCNDYTTTSSGLQTTGCGGNKVATEAYINSKIPTAPVSDGTYMLKCVVSNGEPTYSWEAVSVGGSY